MIFDVDAAGKCLEELKHERERLDTVRNNIAQAQNELSKIPGDDYNESITELTVLLNSFDEYIDSFRSMETALDTVKSVVERTELSVSAGAVPTTGRKPRAVRLIRLADFVPADLLRLIKCR